MRCRLNWFDSNFLVACSWNCTWFDHFGSSNSVFSVSVCFSKMSGVPCDDTRTSTYKWSTKLSSDTWVSFNKCICQISQANWLSNNARRGSWKYNIYRSEQLSVRHFLPQGRAELEGGSLQLCLSHVKGTLDLRQSSLTGVTREIRGHRCDSCEPAISILVPLLSMAPTTIWMKLRSLGFLFLLWKNNE